MSAFVYIHTVSYEPELAVIEGVFESEGIKWKTTNKNTVQVDPFLSNAVGGIHIFVQEEDFEYAKKILLEGGFIREQNNKRFWYDILLEKTTALINRFFK